MNELIARTFYAEALGMVLMRRIYFFPVRLDQAKTGQNAGHQCDNNLSDPICKPYFYSSLKYRPRPNSDAGRSTFGRHFY